MNISNDSYAMLLLCSDLALRNIDNGAKAYTISQWSNLAERLVQNKFTPSKLFDVSSNDEIPQGAVKALREIMQMQVNGQIYDNALPSHEKVMNIFNKQYPVLAKKIAGKKINLGVYDPDGNLVQLPDPQKYFYKVDIPDEAIPRMLDWDKPLSEQAELVKMVQEVRPGYYSGGLPNASAPIGGSDAYLSLVETLGKQGATDFLKAKGYPGIRYLDGSSRNAGQGTSNFVLFDDQLPRILEINGQPTGLLSYADEAARKPKPKKAK